MIAKRVSGRRKQSRSPDDTPGNVMRGRFITFEGGEGTGKSTQAATLAERLRGLGLEVVLTREPGGSPGAEIIRHVLLSGAAKALGADTETVLFAAARADHVAHTIAPALARGAWVVCDRFIDSTRVYQGALGAVDARLLRRLERVAVEDAMPDLTIMLDLPAEIGLARAAGRRGSGAADRFEKETSAYHARVREAYREIAARELGRCVLIDAALAKHTIAEAIWAAVTRRLAPTEAARATAPVP
jgi:dTMP kinase